MAMHASTRKFPSWTIVIVVMVLIITAALWLRVLLPYNQVFTKDWIKMTGVDAYYYMRLVDNLMKHFPQLTLWDIYLRFPVGAETGASPDFFAYLMGGIIWVLSLGQANQHTVDVISAYIPPLLAVLTIVCVFVLGRVFGGNLMGLLSAGLLAIMPGEFLNRSLLGYTDHHIAEVFFSTGMMMFIFLAIRQSEGKSIGEMARLGWKGIGKPLVFGILAGLFMGFYMMTWAGALLFALIIFAFTVVQSVIEHIRGRSSDYCGLLGLCIFGIGLLMYLPDMGSIMVLASMFIGVVISLMLPVVSRFMKLKNMHPAAFPAGILGLGLLAIVVLAVALPGILQLMYGSLVNIFFWRPETTVMEMQPLLIQQGNFTFMVAMGNYMLAFFISLAAILFLFFEVIKKGESGKTLLLIWSVIILLSALAMRRSAYYFAVNVVILTGYLCWLPLNALLTKSEKPVAGAAAAALSHRSRKKAVRQQAKPKLQRNNVYALLLGAAILLLVYYPNIGPLPGGDKPAIDLATRPLFAPSDAWCKAADWLRNSTPEPFDNPDSYYTLYKPVNQPGGYQPAKDAFGVLSWWDYGYWLARIGHRPPATNPGTGPLGTANYFTAQDGPSASRVINNLGTRYVVTDREIAAYDSKFHALASLSGSSYARYYDVFLQKQGSQYAPVILYYPEYYRTMVSRLYNFNGAAVTSAGASVVGYRQVATKEGDNYKEITEKRKFDSYEAAQRYVQENEGRNYILVGEDPYKSPVPLEELRGYKLVYGMGEKPAAGTRPTADIKIFEYTRDVIPLTGDWNGDKKSKLGYWRPDCFFVIDRDGSGQLTSIGPFGFRTDVPLTGDWNGDKKTEIGTWRPSDSCFYLDYNGNGIWDGETVDRKLGPFGFDVTDVPLAGDWNGDARDEVGIWHHDLYSAECYFYLDVNGNGQWELGGKDVKFGPFGNVGDIPIIGDWNGDSRDEVGIWEPGTRYFRLDMDWDGKWDAAKGDIKIGPIGQSYDSPVKGNWDGGNRDLVGIWDPYARQFELEINGGTVVEGQGNEKRIITFPGM